MFRLEEDLYQVNAAAPTYAWLERHKRGYDVTITDMSTKLCVLAIQGPKSRDILKQVAGPGLADLRFFRAMDAKIDGFDAKITRTGYTGDLGYEVWVENANALKLWDALISGGKPYGLKPAALDAMDMTRVEAGFILLDVDYFSSKDCLIESRKSTPDEIGLAWTVHLDREPFIGQAAIRKERREGRKWSLVGLDIDWVETEELFARFGLPPQVAGGAWRTAVPIYCDGEHVGMATSGTFSPILKKNLALASVHSGFDAIGKELQIETTVEFERHTVTARVVETPFFNPERKRTLEPGAAPQKAAAK